MAEKNKLDHNQMLQAEFNYIANTAFQTNEDRSRVTSFYFVSAGSLVAAILGTQFATSPGVSLALAILFLVLTLLGGLTIAQLARLRAAWHESVQAMNAIKDYYIKEDPKIAEAFKWRMKSIPPTDKPYSIANLMALEVALLGGLTAGASAYFFMSAFNYFNLWLVAFGVLIGYMAQWRFYKYLLVDNQ